MEEVSGGPFPTPAFRDALKRTVDEQVRTATTAKLFPTDNLGMKRVRLWEACDNVQELKRMLSEKDKELSEKNKSTSRVGAHNQISQEVCKFHTNRRTERDSLPTGASNSKPSTEKQLESKASQLRRSIRSQVVNQIVYKRSSTGGSRLAPVEISDVLECTIASLHAEASSGPKLVLSNEDVDQCTGRTGV